MLGLESPGSRAVCIFPSSVTTCWPSALSVSVASHCSSKKVQPPHWSLQRPSPFSFTLYPRPRFLLHTMTLQTHGPSRRCHSLLPPSLCPWALHADDSTRWFSRAGVDFWHFGSQPTDPSSHGSALPAPPNQASPVILQVLLGVSPPQHQSWSICNFLLPLLGYWCLPSRMKEGEDAAWFSITPQGPR